MYFHPLFCTFGSFASFPLFPGYCSSTLCAGYWYGWPCSHGVRALLVFMRWLRMLTCYCLHCLAPTSYELLCKLPNVLMLRAFPLLQFRRLLCLLLILSIMPSVGLLYILIMVACHLSIDLVHLGLLLLRLAVV